jgi:surface antigen
MNLISRKYLAFGLIILGMVSFSGCRNSNSETKYIVGHKVDSLNGVHVYYNGSMGNVSGRNTTIDSYNLGLKYQCVEFVKRYYYEHYNHKMPNSWGNAKDFFQNGIDDGTLNRNRNLTQYINPSKTKPKIGDLVIFGGTTSNSYGHVAIISMVNNQKVEVIQQNVGKNTRSTYNLKRKNKIWFIDNDRILGWLRKK